MVLLIKDNGEDQLLDLLVAHQTIRATVDCVATFTGFALIVSHS